MRMPPGTMAEMSPGTVFLLAAIWTDSKTFSTLDPSMPYKLNSKRQKISSFVYKFHPLRIEVYIFLNAFQK